MTPSSDARTDALKRLVATYRDAAVRMRPLPQSNSVLDVEAVGFREHSGRYVGVIVTPWFMNLTVFPTRDEIPVWRVGKTTRLDFPSGPYDFVVSDAGDAGLVATTSLFSLMHDFADMDAARATACAALEALFEPPAPPAPAERKPERVFSRRKLFGG